MQIRYYKAQNIFSCSLKFGPAERIVVYTTLLKEQVSVKKKSRKKSILFGLKCVDEIVIDLKQTV